MRGAPHPSLLGCPSDTREGICPGSHRGSRCPVPPSPQLGPSPGRGVPAHTRVCLVPLGSSSAAALVPSSPPTSAAGCDRAPGFQSLEGRLFLSRDFPPPPGFRGRWNIPCKGNQEQAPHSAAAGGPRHQVGSPSQGAAPLPPLTRPFPGCGLLVPKCQHSDTGPWDT